MIEWQMDDTFHNRNIQGFFYTKNKNYTQDHFNIKITSAWDKVVRGANPFVMTEMSDLGFLPNFFISAETS